MLPHAHDFTERIASTDRLQVLAERAGSPWFSPSAMRFFDSRLGHYVYGNRYFTSSERAPHGARLYSVREFRFSIDRKTGRVRCDVETVGTFQQYGSSNGANAAARRLAKFMGDDADAFPTPEAGLIAAGIVGLVGV